MQDKNDKTALEKLADVLNTPALTLEVHSDTHWRVWVQSPADLHQMYVTVTDEGEFYAEDRINHKVFCRTENPAEAWDSIHNFLGSQDNVVYRGWFNTKDSAIAFVKKWDGVSDETRKEILEEIEQEDFRKEITPIEGD